MKNPVPQRIEALSYEIVWEGPLSKERCWILLRWALLGLVILATLIGNRFIHLDIPELKVLPLCAIVVLLNTLFHYWFFVRKRRVSIQDSHLVHRFTYFQCAVDWVFISLIFHYTGGVASPLLFYFLFHVILTGVLLERRACLLHVSLIALTITAIALFELTGYLPHMHGSSFISRHVQDNPFFVLMLLLFFNTVLYVTISIVLLLLRRVRERIREFIKLKEKLEQANQQLGLLNQLAKDTTSTLGLYPRLNLVCHSIMKMMGLKGATIRLLDERTNLLELASACGLSDAYINKGPVNADKSLAKALGGETHFVLDASIDPAVQYPEEARKEGIVSMLSFPLIGREKVIGTLRLYSGERRSYSQNELDFIGALCSQGAISIENAKIYDTQKKQDEAKSEFIMMMTHELKGPLMAIQGLLEVMLKGYTGTLTEKQQELIRRMYRRIESVMEVSKELLDIYQWQSRRPDVKWVPLSIKEQIQRAVDLFKANAHERELSINIKFPDEDLTLMGTEEDMEKILNNLITNAIKYTPVGGSISLGLSASDDQVILSVKDTGIGVDAEDIPKIFDEFFRTKKAKEMDPYGRGMGLSFVKKVVETLGGTISVKSDKGKGTEFVLTFSKMQEAKSIILE
ncbi:MAG: GAF domain-containing sensor histidine kinase [Deltaproteobacteria bacterium]|nr:GAF domain-containing sensor histidine kinase [Deltaproteobacteria bacterium]